MRQELRGAVRQGGFFVCVYLATTYGDYGVRKCVYAFVRCFGLAGYRPPKRQWPLHHFLDKLVGAGSV